MRSSMQCSWTFSPRRATEWPNSRRKIGLILHIFPKESNRLVVEHQVFSYAKSLSGRSPSR